MLIIGLLIESRYFCLAIAVAYQISLFLLVFKFLILLILLLILKYLLRKIFNSLSKLTSICENLKINQRLSISKAI